MRVLMLALFLLGVENSALGETRCISSTVIHTDAQVSKVRNWDEYYHAYRLFHACDDGAIAEAFSDRVAVLLADPQVPLAHLNTLSRTDQHFRSFVLKHIDETLSQDQLKGLSERVLRQCTIDANAICRDIRRRLDALGASTTQS